MPPSETLYAATVRDTTLIGVAEHIPITMRSQNALKFRVGSTDPVELITFQPKDYIALFDVDNATVKVAKKWLAFHDSLEFKASCTYIINKHLLYDLRHKWRMPAKQYVNLEFSIVTKGFKHQFARRNNTPYCIIGGIVGDRVNVTSGDLFTIDNGVTVMCVNTEDHPSFTVDGPHFCVRVSIDV